jgi:hypothetical protein
MSLAYFDWVMHFRDFKTLHAAVRKQKTRPRANTGSGSIQICRAIDLACVFYFKRVQCLQRSAATTVLLRHRGIDAQMVLGAQLVPFLSHAWVEVDRQVVNDKPYIHDIFHELGRC